MGERRRSLAICSAVAAAARRSGRAGGGSGRPQAWQAYLASVVGMFLYLLVPPLKGNAVVFNTLGLTSWIAVVVGIRRNKPRYALPWWLFAFGFLPVLDG